jgi:hypothetical protein
MSLRAWQDTLAELIVTQGRHPEALDAHVDLSADERAWFERLPNTSGFLMTCAVQRWWRTLAVADSAPLALGLLHAVGRTALFNQYLDEHCEVSLFPLLDGLRFLDFLVGFDVPHLASVARFERALLRLTRAATLSELPTDDLPLLDTQRSLARHPLADVIHFSAPPEEVLGALMEAQTPPDESGDYWLLVAPRLPQFSRLASRAECHLVEGAPLEPAEFEAARATLWAAGALIYGDA